MPTNLLTDCFVFPSLAGGFGICIHTYNGDGDPLPGFEADPYLVKLDNSINEIANRYWDLLNANNRVALAVKSIEIGTRKVEFNIINQLSSQRSADS